MFGRTVYSLDEVYGISRDVPLNYIERESVDGAFRKNLRRGKHITIFGSSKQGKTCLRKHCLNISEYIRFLYKGIIINHNKNRANLH